MAKYLSLITLTDQGIRDVKHTIERAEEFRSKVESAGGQVSSIHWALGEVDGCILFEAPDEQTATALLLGLGQRGNVRTHTLRLYDAAEFKNVLAKA